MHTRLILFATLLLWGCDEAASPPTVTWEGRTFARDPARSQDGAASQLVYLPEGVAFEEADVQLGLIRAPQASVEQLNVWMMQQYAAAPDLVHHYGMTYGTNSACKVGIYQGREFVAIHLCLPHREGEAVCIEADERVVLADLCRLSDVDCWADTCEQRRRRIAPSLQALHDTAFREL